MKNIIKLNTAKVEAAYDTNTAHLLSIIKNKKKINYLFMSSSININFIIFNKLNDFIYDLRFNINFEKFNYIKKVKDYYYDSSQFLNYIDKKLENNIYIILGVNCNKINKYKIVNNEFILHDVLISGLDKINRKVLISDFFNFTDYRSYWIDIEELFSSYNSIQDGIINNLDKITEARRWIFYMTEVNLISPKICSSYAKVRETFIESLNSFLEDNIEIPSTEISSSYYDLYYIFNELEIEKTIMSLKGSGSYIFQIFQHMLANCEITSFERFIKSFYIVKIQVLRIKEILLYLNGTNSINTLKTINEEEKKINKIILLSINMLRKKRINYSMLSDLLYKLSISYIEMIGLILESVDYY